MKLAASCGLICLLAALLLPGVSPPRTALDPGEALAAGIETGEKEAGKKEGAPGAGAAPAADAPADQAALDESFKKALTGATLSGRWRTVEGGKLGEEGEEKYTIQSVAKAGADLWIVVARIQYGGKDVSIPVPVRVKWAGDTPVISVTDAGLPGLGTYTARVMVYRDVYTGAWFGPGHGGLLSGAILREAKPEAKEEPKKERQEG